MSGMIHALLQVPLMSIFAVLAVVLVMICILGTDRRRDFFRLLKGVFVTAVLSVVVFSSVIVLKYFSYLKIDIMQLGAIEVIFFGTVFAYAILSRSLGGGRIPFSVPYPLKQAALFLAALGYLLWADTGLELYWVVVAIMPLNVVYHLYYIKILGKVFSRVVNLSRKLDEKVMVRE